jgi:hypothetical protein
MIPFIDAESFTVNKFDLINLGQENQLDFSDTALRMFDYSQLKRIEFSTTFEYCLDDAIFILVENGKITFLVEDREVIAEKNDLLLVCPKTNLKIKKGGGQVIGLMMPLKENPTETSALYQGINCSFECTPELLKFPNLELKNQALSKLIMHEDLKQLQPILGYQSLNTSKTIFFPEKKFSRHAYFILEKSNKEYEKVFEQVKLQSSVHLKGVMLNPFITDRDFIFDVMKWMKFGEKSDYFQVSQGNLKLF